MSLGRVLPDVAIPQEWRVGDLLTLRKVAPRRLTLLPPMELEPWQEATLGPVRVKMRSSQSTRDVEPLIPGDILRTVSRRDAIRPRIGMWTSGNRVYGLVNVSTIGALIASCHRDWADGRFTIATTLAQARQLGINPAVAEKLFGVLQAELSEHAHEAYLPCGN
jgi:hypothetical protein